MPLGVLAASAVVAHAQTAPQSAPSDVLMAYQNATSHWAAVGFAHAQTLFGILAAIEVAWTASMLALEKDSIESWIAPVIKKIMVIGFFYMLLMSNQIWMPAIINSFTQIGQEAAGLPVGTSMNPSDILMMGLTISGQMLAAAMPGSGNPTGLASLIPSVGAILSPASLIPTLIVLIGSVMVFLAYLIITISFVMATIESYIALGAGVIFLGFGASRWTTPYVERYLSLAVSTGVRLMVLYMIIGLGQTLSAQWITDAQSLTLSVAGCQSIFGIVAGAMTYMAIAWSVPKMVSGVLSGSLSMSSGEMTGAMTALAVGGATTAAAVASGGTALAGVGAAAAAGAGATGAAGSGAAGFGAGGMFSAGSVGGGASAASMTTEAGASLAVDPIAEAGGSLAGGAAGTSGGGGASVDPISDGMGESTSASGARSGGDTSAASSGSAAPSGGLATKLKSLRDEASHLAAHAPDDSSPASAPQLNIGHGE
jgi:type IV secretion system protein TrbL